MILLLLFAFDQPQPTGCVIDRCEGDICVVDTPEGVVEVPRKRGYHEGKEVECPLWLIDPTLQLFDESELDIVFQLMYNEAVIE